MEITAKASEETEKTDFEKAEQKHLKCFRSTDSYIPLTVRVKSPSVSGHTLWDRMNSAKITAEAFEEENSLSMDLKSDWIPVVESNFLENLVPGLLGAEICRSPGGLITAKPFLNDISDQDKLFPSKAFDDPANLPGSAILESALSHYCALREIFPVGSGVRVLMPRFASPLDYAVMIRGADFYADLMLEPESARSLMLSIAHLTIGLIKIFKALSGEILSGQTTIRGLHFPGIRLTGDAVVNLPPDLIRSFMFTLYDIFAAEFGSVMLHYCTSPAPSGHVLPVLTECSSIKCVDNWHGHKSFFDKNLTGYLQNKVSVCTDLSTDKLSDPDSLLNDPFFSEVPRKGGRGITASVMAESVSEGRELYDAWTSSHIHQMR